MSNKTNITPGVWTLHKSQPALNTYLIEAGGRTIIDIQPRMLTGAIPVGQAQANLALIPEAGTVTNECGKTPRELLELVRELRGLLQNNHDVISGLPISHYDSAMLSGKTAIAIEKTKNI